uniref:Putative venom metalloprotease n=1 Tax=Pimpla hypochondriaca TaxID=135724 RepID=Q8WPC7_PIMHY|nr:putative venom metalloprotease [Pimpla hypochondriaca]
MTRFIGWIILFCVAILVGLCDAITSNEAIFRNMSSEEIRSFFATEDGSVPKFELVKLTKPAQSNRAANVLYIPFSYHGIRTTAILSLVPDQDLISTTTTAVWFAKTNREARQNVAYTPRPDILDGIGTFEFYQNEYECSAITIFRRSRSEVSMIGILKQDYTVRSLPRGYENGFRYVNSSHIIVSRSVDSESDQDEDPPLYLVIYKNEKPSQKYFRRRTSVIYDDKPPYWLLELVQAPFFPPNVVYPKLLIAPAYDVVSSEGSVEAYIMLLIAQLNALDMMYRQMKNPDVRLKIGGIIIPRDPSAMPYIRPGTNGFDDAKHSLTLTNDFFKKEDNRLQTNTYSAVIVLATKQLYEYNGGVANFVGLSLEYPGTNCETGIAMVKYSRGFGGVLTIAHELGHVFSAPRDGATVPCPADNGYTMVQDVNLARMLKWSTCSQRIFSAFFRSLVARCTHSRPVGVPKGVHSMPGSWMSLEGQCENHMWTSVRPCYYANDCSRIICRDNLWASECHFMSEPPLEGSLSWDGMRCVNHTWMNVRDW